MDSEFAFSSSVVGDNVGTVYNLKGVLQWATNAIEKTMVEYDDHMIVIRLDSLEESSGFCELTEH